MGLWRLVDETGEAPALGLSFGKLTRGRVLDRAFTAQGGDATHIQFDTGSPVETDSFKGAWVAIISGTGAGQIRLIQSYVGSTKTALVSPSWSVNPNATSVCRAFFAKRFGVQNIGDESLISVVGSLVADGVSDGISFPKWALDTVALSCPYNVAAVVSAGSGTWAGTGTRGYRLVGVKGSGRTVGSLEVLAVIAATSNEVDLSWTALPGSPDNIWVFRTDTPGDYSGDVFLAELAGGATTYNDPGDATTGDETFPLVDSTGGYGAATPYGVPPTLATSDLVIGTIQKGRIIWTWEGVEVGSGSAVGPGRTWRRRFVAA